MVDNRPSFEIKDESGEARKNANDRFRKMAVKLGLDKLDIPGKIDFLKKTTAPKFLELLAYGNGKLINIKKQQKWTQKSVHSVVSMGGSWEFADLESPEKADLEFQKFYQEMQLNIDEKNYKLWSAKLYFALINSHMFANGNGRLGRVVYKLFKQDGLPADLNIEARPRGMQGICREVTLNGIASLYKQMGLLKEDQVINDMDQYLFKIEGMAVEGDMNYLRYLAAYQVLKAENSQQDLKVIEFKDLNAKQRKDFDLVYADLRQKWFHEVFKFLDEYPEWIVQELDRII